MAIRWVKIDVASMVSLISQIFEAENRPDLTGGLLQAVSPCSAVLNTYHLSYHVLFSKIHEYAHYMPFLNNSSLRFWTNLTHWLGKPERQLEP